MSYISVPDFKFGMDRRRQRVAGSAGTLWTLVNGVISRGGDIESAKQFVPTYTLPAGTFGMYRVRKQLYVFGSQAPPTMPQGVLYQQLPAPSGQNMTGVRDVRSFSGKLYVIAEFDDGNIYHYYNGGRVTDWDAIADGNCDITTTADYLASKINNDPNVSATSAGGTITVTALVPGTAFTLSGSVTYFAGGSASLSETTIQNNVSAVAEVAATGSITITGGTASAGVNMITDAKVGTTSLLSGGPIVNWAISNTATASALAAAINNQTARHGYTATSSGATVTIQAGPGVGATINGAAVTTTVAGTVTTTTVNMSGGVTAVAAVAQISVIVLANTFNSQDIYTITVNSNNYKGGGRASGMGIACLPSKNRMWCVAGTLLVGSALNTPNDFHTTASASSGYVAIDTSNASEGNERLLGLAEYSAYLAIFSTNAIRLYSLAADATQISYYKAIQNTGTLASRAIVAQGSDDVFFLAPTGIRDLRPRDVINVAYVSDIGTAIDPFVRSQINAINGATLAQAISVVEPIDGRIMMAIGGYIFVLSYFTSSRINAWSYFNPGFQVTDWTVIGTQLYARSGNTIYLYGGTQGTVYPAANQTPVTAELPFLSANTPPEEKLMADFDMACSNQWLIEMLVDPDDETKIIQIGTATKTTYANPNMGAAGRTTHFALRLTCSAGGFASVSSLAISFHGEDHK